MTQDVRTQLQKLAEENEIKRDVRPRPIRYFSCNVKTEREMEAERGERVIIEKLYDRIFR